METICINFNDTPLRVGYELDIDSIEVCEVFAADSKVELSGLFATSDFDELARLIEVTLINRGKDHAAANAYDAMLDARAA